MKTCEGCHKEKPIAQFLTKLGKESKRCRGCLDIQLKYDRAKAKRDKRAQAPDTLSSDWLRRPLV